jgi:hypothetical protein
MSDLVIFGFGSIVFIISTWATLTFGLAKMQELALADAASSPRIEKIVAGEYTDVYRTAPLPSDGVESDTPTTL